MICNVVLASLFMWCREAAQKALSAYHGFMQIGGGINPQNAAEWLDAGASHVIVTSYVFKDGQLNEDRLQELVRYGHRLMLTNCKT